MRKSFLFSLLFLLVFPASSQSVKRFDVAEYQDKIDKTQQALDVLFCDLYAGKKMGKPGDYKSFSQILFSRIDSLQNFVASLANADSSKKIQLYDGIEKGLWSLYDACTKNNGDCASITDFANAYEAAAQLDLRNASILPVVQRSALPVATILVAAVPFQENEGIQESKENLVRRVFSETPQNLLPVLFDHPEVSLFDSLVAVIAKKQAGRLYDYAQAEATGFGRRLKKVNDPLVKWIVRLSGLNTGRLYFPFLDNLVAGRVSFEEIGKAAEADDKRKYFQLLVRTAIDYRAKMEKGDTASSTTALYQALQQKAVDDFIYPINDLHGLPDAIRLRSLSLLAPADLYYLLVMSEDAIYTSSYLKIYHRMFSLMKKPDSHQLLENVHYDHYKRFIRLAANFNTLEHFLQHMNRRFSDELLKAFVSGLEDAGNLEDAVNVADSYGSIHDAGLQNRILEEVTNRLAAFKAQGHENGVAIYGLLQKMFQSLHQSSPVNLSSSFGLPSVYSLSNGSLRDSAGRILIQQFFYGDEDGISQYAKFIATYKKAGWLIKGNDYWTTVQSVKGVPIVFYVNKPLDNESEQDAKAQENLNLFLKKNRLWPAIVIHRGHSYHLSSTVSQLAPSAKLVILGSCGGYQNLSGVLKVCPTAQIISTKQEGSGAVNEPMIFHIVQRLQNNGDLQWPAIWQNLQTTFRREERFADYIPPYRNLGALLLMAVAFSEGKQVNKF